MPELSGHARGKALPRGRARLLWEMLNGEVLTDGWKSEPVHEALDLCLSCKGCKGDCPVNVDMATYKAEFLSHYYEGRLRPRHAYAMGWIHWWAKLASLMPGWRTSLAKRRFCVNMAKWVGGIAPQRQPAAFCRARPFGLVSPARRSRRLGQAPPVILWPDTFNNHFHPDIAKAGVEVLEAAGYQVRIPRARLLWPAAVRLRHVGPRQTHAAPASSMHCGRRLKRGCRSWAWSRVALPFSGMN